MNVIYEHPLTEQARFLHKIEAVYLEIEDLLKNRQKLLFTNILFLLIELEDLVNGQDIRIELLKALHKKKTFLAGLTSNPDVNDELLEKTLMKIGQAEKTLRYLDVPPGENLRTDQFIQAVKCKYNLRGTLNTLELPHLNYWAHREQQLHLERIHYWLEDLVPMIKTVELILQLSRDSGAEATCSADKGFYQYENDRQATLDLIRVTVKPSLQAFPEITGNKHKFLVRFLEEKGIRSKPIQATNCITFELALITL